MPRRRDPRPAPALEIKTARLDGLRLILNTAERDLIAAHLDAQFAGSPDFFTGETAWLDGSRLADARPDWAWLAAELRTRGLRLIGVTGSGVEQHAAIRDAGLITLAHPTDAPTDDARATAWSEPALPESAPAQAVTATPEDTGVAIAPVTRIIDKPLRSGQRIYAAGDVVILAAVNPGAEVIADGNIHVYAPLMGRALAGARGAADARIFALRLEAELVSIAGVYRTFEQGSDPSLSGHPVQVRLGADSTLDIIPL